MGDILDVPLVSPFSASIRLFDGNGIALPNARFQASVSGVVISEGVSDDDAIAKIDNLGGARACFLKWAFDATGPLHFGHEVLVDERALSTDRKLQNLGYADSDEDGLADRVIRLQREFGLEETGVAADVASFVAAWHDQGQIVVPPRPEEAAPPDPEFTDDELDEDGADG